MFGHEEDAATQAPRWARNMEARLTDQVNDLQERLTRDLANAVTSIVSQLQQPVNIPAPATGIKATIGGTMSTVSLSVDVNGETLHLDWVDDKGDLTTGPIGATLAVTSSDTTVTTVGPVATDAAGTGGDAPLSFLKAGSTVLTGTGNDASGVALPGFTATVDLTLTPGPAASLMASVAGAPPVPVPPATGP